MEKLCSSLILQSSTRPIECCLDHWHIPLAHQGDELCSWERPERCWDNTGSVRLQSQDSISTKYSSLQMTFFLHHHQSVWCHTVWLLSGHCLSAAERVKNHVGIPSCLIIPSTLYMTLSLWEVAGEPHAFFRKAINMIMIFWIISFITCWFLISLVWDAPNKVCYGCLYTHS